MVSLPLTDVNLALKRRYATGLEYDLTRTLVPHRKVLHLLSASTKRDSEDESSLSATFRCEESVVNEPI